MISTAFFRIYGLVCDICGADGIGLPADPPVPCTPHLLISPSTPGSPPTTLSHSQPPPPAHPPPPLTSYTFHTLPCSSPTPARISPLSPEGKPSLQLNWLLVSEPCLHIYPTDPSPPSAGPHNSVLDRIKSCFPEPTAPACPLEAKVCFHSQTWQ